jgi:hypothetical protein
MLLKEGDVTVRVKGLEQSIKSKRFRRPNLRVTGPDWKK